MKAYDRVSCFIRASLHRRLFTYSGVGLLLTFMTFMAVTRLVDGPEGAPWRKEMQRVHAFTTGRFVAAWNDPVAREELAAALARDMELGVVLRDAGGAVISAHGGCDHSLLRAPVRQDGQVLGSLEVCADKTRWGSPFRYAVPFLLAVLVLWALSGTVARRLARPLQEVAQVAREIGAGNLQSRAQLSAGQPGEVGALAVIINEMAAKIEKQMADQRQLLAAVSHELRTPLARIRILTELARDKGVDQRGMDEIDREVGELDGLVGDLLANSRLEFTALTFRPQDGALLAARALERAGLEATLLHAPDATVALEADATLLSRALQNLVDNAQGHGGGLTAMKVTPQGDHVAFEAEDAGPGFKDGEGARAFEAFYHNGANGHGTLGLGLALVQRIAKAHGGEAYARNREGGGALVGFTVMVHPPKKNAAASTTVA